jgi:ectoine hydroxylase-related dioxygenase (phytanoyl-CoA dioxygenase family)
MHRQQEHLRAWRERGYFVIPGWLAGSVRRGLTEACDHALRRARAESSVAGHLTTHLPNVLVPDYFRERPEALANLVEFVGSPAVLELVRDLGRPLEGELELRSVQYFHEPSTRDYDGPWHRDGDEATPIAPVPSARRATLVRFRIALAPDDHLEYVPGSHARPDSDEELRIRRGALRNGPLPSEAERIALEAGDLCVFDTWGIHRGRYRHSRVRRTLDLVFGYGPRTLNYDFWKTLRSLRT